jgi:hypothetical protein
MPLDGFAASPSSRWPSSAFLWLLALLAMLHMSWLQNSNFVLFVINVLINGEIEKPSGQYLGLIVMSHWLVMVWIRIRDISVVLPYYSCGESCLLVSWCVGDKCDVAGSDEDRGRSRIPGAEHWGWSSIRRVLGGQTIERSGDAVCSLHRAQGDEEHGFLSWASKPRLVGFPIWASKPAATIRWFGPQNHHDGFLVWASKPSGWWFVGYAAKLIGGGWRGTRV